MTWHNQYFVDFTLPFDLRSAPFIFDSVANMVQWILQHRYQVRYLFHYLDDFLTLGAAASNECAENIGITKVVFARLGLPLHPSKCEDRTTILVFLGIQLDSVRQIARLSCGFGAICGNAWFYGSWPLDFGPASITVLVLLPIVVPAHL
jgi:hypothetical protein